ncbi:MAG: hypothetical protein WEB60_01100, partial [Terrimicrobiaceae bacterium]
VERFQQVPRPGSEMSNRRLLKANTITASPCIRKAPSARKIAVSSLSAHTKQLRNNYFTASDMLVLSKPPESSCLPVRHDPGSRHHEIIAFSCGGLCGVCVFRLCDHGGRRVLPGQDMLSCERKMLRQAVL